MAHSLFGTLIFKELTCLVCLKTSMVDPGQVGQGAETSKWTGKVCKAKGNTTHMRNLAVRIVVQSTASNNI
jgi:hypothetical protein